MRSGGVWGSGKLAARGDDSVRFLFVFFRSFVNYMYFLAGGSSEPFVGCHRGRMILAHYYLNLSRSAPVPMEFQSIRSTME